VATALSGHPAFVAASRPGLQGDRRLWPRGPVRAHARGGTEPSGGRWGPHVRSCPSSPAGRGRNDDRRPLVRCEPRGSHTCARHADGTASCWGRNEWGLRDGTTTDGLTSTPVVGRPYSTW